jgi:hypothetical protein
VDGCTGRVQKPGHTLCYEHWKAKQKVGEEPASYQVSQAASKGSDAAHGENNGMLSATALGEHFKLAARQINTILFELGWIEKNGEGWQPSKQGEKLKAEKILWRNHAPRVVWHPGICKSRVLQNAVAEFRLLEEAQLITPQVDLPTEEVAGEAEGFRDKFPPTIRAFDGHMVRSRGEAMIDGLLYENRIVHAYERLVPIEQTMYCDFFLPEYNLYIEFWGMESNPKYKARKEKKLDLYRQNELRLIEVKDEHINNLEDYLLVQLIKFGYKPR